MTQLDKKESSIIQIYHDFKYNIVIKSSKIITFILAYS